VLGGKGLGSLLEGKFMLSVRRIERVTIKNRKKWWAMRESKLRSSNAAMRKFRKLWIFDSISREMRDEEPATLIPREWPFSPGWEAPT
jgi:hypothetical protein